MFSNRRIKCSLGRTINLGNFESVRIDVELSADIDNLEDLQIAQGALHVQVLAELLNLVEEHTPKKNTMARGKTRSSEDG